MKRLLLSLVAAVVLAFPCANTHAAGSAVVLMSAQTASGPGVSAVTTSGEAGVDRYNFQYHASIAGSPNNVGVQIQMSLDAGTTWSPVYTFGNHGQDEAWSMFVCGACRLRAVKLATTAGAATVTALCSGTASCIAP